MGRLAHNLRAAACQLQGVTELESTRELLLISVTGRDRTDFTPAICAVLARHDVEMLDMSQAVIHDQATLGMVVAMAEGADSPALIKDVLYRSHELGVTARFEPLEQHSFDAWAARLDRSRYIVTLLARHLTGEHLARVTEVAHRFGQRIEAVRRLSGSGAAQEPGRERASIEISVRGEPPDPAAIQRKRSRIPFGPPRNP